MDDDSNTPRRNCRNCWPIDEGFDVVYGFFASRNSTDLLRDLASQITKLALAEAMGAANARQVSALRVFRTELREAFAGYRSPTVNIDVLLTWAQHRIRSGARRARAAQVRRIRGIRLVLVTR